MTDDLVKRTAQHKAGTYEHSFTARYTFDMLVYYEAAVSQTAAVERERQIKGWSRAKKVALIQASNPNWADLSLSWGNRLMLH